MSSYCAISPTSSAPWLRRRATTSSMSSTANMTRRMPSAFAGAFFGSALTAGGVWNFVSSTRSWPSGVRTMAMAARTPLSPTMRSTQLPSTVVWPSSSMPSSAKNAGVSPLPVQRIPPKIDLLHLLLRDLDPRGIDTLVQFAGDPQARLGRRRRNEVDDRLVTHQRLASPVLADEREEPMLDLVPLTRPRGEVAHRDLQLRLIRQPLEFRIPEPDS